MTTPTLPNEGIEAIEQALAIIERGDIIKPSRLESIAPHIRSLLKTAEELKDMQSFLKEENAGMAHRIIHLEKDLEASKKQIHELQTQYVSQNPFVDPREEIEELKEKVKKFGEAILWWQDRPLTPTLPVSLKDSLKHFVEFANGKKLKTRTELEVEIESLQQQNAALTRVIKIMRVVMIRALEDTVLGAGTMRSMLEECVHDCQKYFSSNAQIDEKETVKKEDSSPSPSTPL